MRKYNYSESLGSTEFDNKVANSIKNAVKAASVNVTAKSLLPDKVTEQTEQFTADVIVDGVKFRASMSFNCQNGEVTFNGVINNFLAGEFGFAYDEDSHTLLGGYADNGSFEIDFWLSGVMPDEVGDAKLYCETHFEDYGVIVGDWQTLKDA